MNMTHYEVKFPTYGYEFNPDFVIAWSQLPAGLLMNPYQKNDLLEPTRFVLFEKREQKG